MGKAKVPSPSKLPAAPANPDANEEAKAAAGAAASAEKRRSIASSSEGSFGRSPAALGSPSTNTGGASATLKPTLGA